MSRPPTRGAVADLTRVAKEQREAELALKKLECRVQQLSVCTANDEIKSRLLDDAAARHDEVKRMKEEGRRELERQSNERKMFVKAMHEREAERRKLAKNVMMHVFSDKTEDAVTVKQKWKTSLQQHIAEETRYAEMLKEASQDERRKAASRRAEIVESMQTSKIRMREEVIRTAEQLRSVRGESAHENDEAKQRAKEQRDRTKLAIKKAREEVETRNMQTRVEMLDTLTRTRLGELSKIKAQMHALEAEQALLQSKKRATSV